MGIVLRQSIINSALTYVGFALGAINTLFLYTRMLSDVEFGLVGVILSTAAILMPLLSFGIPNALIKFYPGFRDSDQADSFLTLMLLLPLMAIVPTAVCFAVADSAVSAFLARENAIVGGYVWHIFAVGLAMAYFEVFFSWSKICLKSAWGTFLKEVFVRAGVTLLLVLLSIGVLDVAQFLWALVGVYVLRMGVMGIYALRLRGLRLKWARLPNTREMVEYSALILIGGSVSVLLLEVDRFMINQYIEIENVAYYTVAVFIATVIIVPLRAMHQITYPITASLVHEGKFQELSALYKRSSLGLLLTTTLIFLLILLNLKDLYALLPESYAQGYWIVLMIGVAKLVESFLGINSAILYNSPYYRTLLLMGVLLAGLTILLNALFIPRWGMFGAAVATLIAVVAYNLAKGLFVRWKYHMHPLSRGSWQVLLLAFFTWVLFVRLDFEFHPLLNIVLKSIGIVLLYLGVALRLRLSEDLNTLFSRWF